MRDALDELLNKELELEPQWERLRTKERYECERLADLIFYEIQRALDHEYCEPINLRETLIHTAYVAIGSAKQERRRQIEAAEQWGNVNSINPVQIARDMNIALEMRNIIAGDMDIALEMRNNEP